MAERAQSVVTQLREVNLVATDDADRWGNACLSAGQPVSAFLSYRWLQLAARRMRICRCSCTTRSVPRRCAKLLEGATKSNAVRPRRIDLCYFNPVHADVLRSYPDIQVKAATR
jgi:hypothetical protein